MMRPRQDTPGLSASPALLHQLRRMLSLACLSMAGTCFGALEWQTTRVEKSAVAGDPPVVATFRFENKGSATLTITSIASDCGCTTTELKRRRYAPGESGEISAEFDLGSRVGRQEKAIQVTTDVEPGQPTTLVLAVDIAEPVHAQPRLAAWRTGEANEVKTIEISAADGKRIQRVEVAADDRVSATVEPVLSGRTYRLQVKPRSTAAAASIPVRCTVHFDGRAPAQLTVFVLVN